MVEAPGVEASRMTAGVRENAATGQDRSTGPDARKPSRPAGVPSHGTDAGAPVAELVGDVALVIEAAALEHGVRLPAGLAAAAAARVLAVVAARSGLPTESMA